MAEKEKKLEKISKVSLLLGILWLAVFVSRSSLLAIPGIVCVVLVAPVALILSLYFGKKATEEEEELWLGFWKLGVDDAIGGTELDRFYIECVLARCTDFTLPKNKEKAILLAQKYGIAYPDGIEALFLEARENHGTIGDELRARRFEQLKEYELRVYRESLEYAHYRGKEKMRIMLSDSISTLKGKVDQLADTAVASAPILEKEHNWAAWGGFANGLAGPAAGVAVALDAQIDNIRIREQNQQMLKDSWEYRNYLTTEAARLLREANWEQEILDSLAEKLLDDKISSSDVFSLLDTPKNVNVEVSETGAFRVTASIEAKQPIRIFGDVAAIVDGTILAHVYEDNLHIGTATMVLPKRGVPSFGVVPLIGIGLTGANPDKKQTVRFEAGHLWLIEV